MTYLEELEYKTLNDELARLRKIVEKCEKELEYDPTEEFLKFYDKLSKEKELDKKVIYATHAENWRKKALAFDLIKHLDKWQKKQIEAESKISDIMNRLFSIEYRNKRNKIDT